MEVNLPEQNQASYLITHPKPLTSAEDPVQHLLQLSDRDGLVLQTHRGSNRNTSSLRVSQQFHPSHTRAVTAPLMSTIS